jgi:hypothetical protein
MGKAEQIKIEQHIAQWKHNRLFAKTIDSKYRDWQINVIFYTALHVIDAALALCSLGISVTDHSSRNDKVKTNNAFAPIRNKYFNLYRISRITRYDANPDQWLPKEYLTVTDLVEDLLKPIEEGIGPLINKSVKFEPLKLNG